jgi:hypothetical protein
MRIHLEIWDLKGKLKEEWENISRFAVSRRAWCQIGLPFHCYESHTRRRSRYSECSKGNQGLGAAAKLDSHSLEYVKCENLRDVKDHLEDRSKATNRFTLSKSPHL